MMASLATLLALSTITCLLTTLHPYRVWLRIARIARHIARDSALTLGQKFRLLAKLSRSSVAAAFLTIPAIVDQVAFRGWRKTSVIAPVFLIGQPRSGTTFLHRTLSESGSFTSVPHFHWRYPFACVWWAVEKLGLYERLAARTYWPNSEAGILAAKLHPHVMGDVEEHGIFMEERLFHHYFLTRALPTLDGFRYMAYYESLNESARREYASHILDVVRKYQWFYGLRTPWLTKENESVDIYREIIPLVDEARIVFVHREPSKSIPSYAKLSVTSTLAKTDIDPSSLHGWEEMNMQFRADEIDSMLRLVGDLPPALRVAHVRYEDFVEEMPKTVEKMSESLSLDLDPRFMALLRDRQRKQRQRSRGYTNDIPVDRYISEFVPYRRFISSLPQLVDRISDTQV